MKREGTSNLPFPAWTGVILTLFLILIDQVTKLLALSQLKGNPDIILIPGVLQLKYLENRGMAFGMLQGKIPLLIALCLLFFCVFLYIYIKKPKQAMEKTIFAPGEFLEYESKPNEKLEEEIKIEEEIQNEKKTIPKNDETNDC